MSYAGTRMAMLPFIGYNANDYLQHWVNIGEKGRLLEWVINRLEGKVEAIDNVPEPIQAEFTKLKNGLSA